MPATYDAFLTILIPSRIRRLRRHSWEVYSNESTMACSWNTKSFANWAALAKASLASLEPARSQFMVGIPR
jgi:uncharacterized membrane protein YcfT